MEGSACRGIAGGTGSNDVLLVPGARSTSAGRCCWDKTMGRDPKRKAGWARMTVQERIGGQGWRDVDRRVSENPPLRGWVLYDAGCSTCLHLVNRARRIWERRGFRFIPLQSADAAKLLGSADKVPLTELKLCLPDGQVSGGAAAIAHLLLAVGWLKWLGWCLRLPMVRNVAGWIYRGWARRRKREMAACSWSRGPQATGDRDLTLSR